MDARAVDGFSVTLTGSPEGLYGRALLKAFESGAASRTKLTPFVLALAGMSGRCYRATINNLIESLSDARYLEVGCWAGSTACSAIEGNEVRAVCIDNWSEFGGPKEAFLANTAACASDRVDFTFIESDFRAVDFTALGKFNVYLFDGPHARADQYDGVRLALPALDDEFVFIVDDWNWDHVRDGTWDAITASGLKVNFSIEVRTTQDNTHPVDSTNERSEWHNGYFLGVVSKPH